MSWTYSQSTGWLTGPGLMIRGYAGHGDGKNNPTKQEIHNMGPIPQGTWLIEAPQNKASTGPFSLPLTPQEGTVTFGRSGFFIHGDSISHPGEASDGCICLPRAAREFMWNSGVHTLTVCP